mmetsp:Transcript_55101/g.128939  ORF Transcript_55101/g.128939 Transcript_55101/m.128939 type:complete len:203 (+) Transcript_55101:321-929(+)
MSSIAVPTPPTANSLDCSSRGTRSMMRAASMSKSSTAEAILPCGFGLFHTCSDSKDGLLCASSGLLLFDEVLLCGCQGCLSVFCCLQGLRLSLSSRTVGLRVAVEKLQDSIAVGRGCANPTSANIWYSSPVFSFSFICSDKTSAGTEASKRKFPALRPACCCWLLPSKNPLISCLICSTEILSLTISSSSHVNASVGVIGPL